MGPAGTTLSVALRSALISGSRAQVFVGAGIVRGSTAEAEWLETERKSKAMLPALGVHHG
jgi:isochorismate synthase EntC